MNKWTAGLFLIVLSAFWCGPVCAAQTADDYRSATKLYSEKNYVKAAEAFKTILTVEPNYVPALQGLGSCYYQLGQKKEALVCYEKVLALAPSNQQIEAFVQRLRKALGGVPAEPPVNGIKNGSMADGLKRFQAGQYEAAIPYFQIAVVEDPKNAAAFYDLGYSQFITGDPKEAVVNYTLSDRIKPDAKLKKDIVELRSILSLEDLDWVDSRLGIKSEPRVLGGAPAGKSGAFGLRFFQAASFVNISDFQNDAKTNGANTQQLLNSDPTYRYTAEVPSVFFQSEMEPVIALSPQWEIGFPLGYIAIGNYTGTLSNAAGYSDYFNFDTRGFSAGLDFRYFLGDGSLKFFLGGGLSLAYLQLHYTETVGFGGIYGYGYGDFSALAFLPRLQTGLDFHLGNTFVLTPFVSYQFGASGAFRGNMRDSSGYSYSSGQLDVYDQPNGSKVIFFPENPSPPSYPGLRAFAMDLSGFQAGVCLSAFF